jgi:hypothetical protein
VRRRGGGRAARAGVRAPTALPRHRVCARQGSGHAAHAVAAAWGACGTKAARRYEDILFIFRPPPARPRAAPRFCEPTTRRARVRAVRATAVNKNNVSG